MKGVTGLMETEDAGRRPSLSGEQDMPLVGKDAEWRLLEAIEHHGEVTPARAALEAKLTVAEADRLLTELAESGYLEVRVEDEKMVYRL